MILIALAVAVAMLAGVQARRQTARTDLLVHRVLDFVLYVLLPVIGFAFASRLELELSTVTGILGGYLAIGIVGLIAWQLASRVLRLSRKQQGSVVLASVLANTGYLGLPVAATLLGKDELPQAVAWDQLISAPMALLVAPFIAGAFAGHHEGSSMLRQLPVIIRRAPAIPALIAGLLVPDAWVPHWALDFATVCVYATLPLGFFAVGATIQRLRGDDDEQHPPGRAVGATVLLRLAVAPALFFAIGALVLPDEPRAFMLQAAMPCGINALVVGHAFDLDRGLIAHAIAWSTGLALVGALLGLAVL